MTTWANIYVDQGADYNATLDFTEAVSESDYDITDHDFYSAVSKVYSSAVIFNPTLTPVQGDTNELDFTISASQTKNIAPGKYRYDIFMKDPSGNLDKVLEGLLVLIPSITKDTSS